jgi:hypothetical protein
LREPFTVASTLAGWRLGGVGTAPVYAVFLLISGGAMEAASAQVAPIDRPAAIHPYAGHVADAARRFGIPEEWIWAVMRVESNGDPRAVSAAGALGLMQIMPTTWGHLRARYGLGSDPYDVRDNIMAGAAYLREMHDRYGDATAMLASYNAGPGRYDEFRSRGRPLPAETRAYLARLAPITGVSGDARLAAVPPPDPFAWRRAALFARPANAAHSDTRAQAGSELAAAEPRSDLPPVRVGNDGAPVAPAHEEVPTETLFVSRTRAGRPQ